MLDYQKSDFLGVMSHNDFDWIPLCGNKAMVFGRVLNVVSMDHIGADLYVERPIDGMQQQVEIVEELTAKDEAVLLDREKGRKAHVTVHEPAVVERKSRDGSVEDPFDRVLRMQAKQSLFKQRIWRSQNYDS